MFATPTAPATENEPVAILTSKGVAARAAYQLVRALRALDDDTRDEIMGLLYLEMVVNR